MDLRQLENGSCVYSKIVTSVHLLAAKTESMRTPAEELTMQSLARVMVGNCETVIMKRKAVKMFTQIGLITKYS